MQKLTSHNAALEAKLEAQSSALAGVLALLQKKAILSRDDLDGLAIKQGPLGGAAATGVNTDIDIIR